MPQNPNVTLINDPALIAKYETNGLTYISDNSDILPRDKAGNIIATSDTSSNSLIIIEPVTTIYTMESALNVFDTRFKYFKFPTNIVAETETDIDIDTTDFESDLLRRLIEQDLEIPYEEDQFGIAQGFRRLNTSYPASWFTNGAEIIDGVDNNGNLAGATVLPFQGPGITETGRYQITNDVVNALQSTGKTIQFNIQIQTNSQGDANTSYTLELNRFSKINGSARSFNPKIQVNTTGTGYPVLQITYKIDPQDLLDKDVYDVRAVAGNPAWYLRDQTYWNISLVDADGNYGLI
jgi:hypothetical protein